MSNLAESTLAEFRSQLAPVEKRHSDIDVAFELQRQVQADRFSEDDEEFLDQAARRIDVGGRIYTHYSKDWKRLSDKQLDEPWLTALALLLFRRVGVRNMQTSGNAILLKQLNALFKCIELADSDYFADDSPLRREIDSLLDAATADSGEAIPRAQKNSAADGDSPREIALTVLFHEGPIARAYLETIRSMGLKPQRIIRLIAARDIASGKPVGRFLPSAMRRPFAARIQQEKIHHWPRTIKRSSPELYQGISNWVAANLGFGTDTQRAALQMTDLSAYCDQVEELLVSDLKDAALYEYLARMPETALLYTGGGIVPESLLSIPSIRMLHVHPGYLPAIRGADCALWSVLLTGVASASSFYLAPGIDTGDVVVARWLPRPAFDVHVADYPPLTLYRAVYAWYDPWLRSSVLRETLAASENYLSMPSKPQNETSGTQFHFMHDRMRELALTALFQGQRAHD